jgi:hypothetical protein
MGNTALIKRSIDRANRADEPIGYVFMVAMQPKGPMRDTRQEAIQDAVNAREARIDMQYGRVFFEPMTWVAPIWP